ncbi:MAG: hypothetical protein PVJ57_08675 [Phycisphaerae bacterium]|jgi:hypothetical protein
MIVNLLWLIVLFVAAGVTARAILRHLPPEPGDSPAERAIAGATVFVTCTLAAGLLPATVAEMTGLPLVTLPIMAVLMTVSAIVLQFCGRARPPAATLPAARRWRLRLSRVLLLTVALPVALLHVGLLIEGALRPPIGADGLFYHLPNVVRWLAHGRLDIVPGLVHPSTSGNGDVWMMLFAATRVEPLIELSFVPFGPLLALTVVLIARELGARRHGAVTAGLLVLATPMISLQMYSSYVDLFGTTFLAVGVYYLLRMLRATGYKPVPQGNTRHIVVAGLSLGVAIGTKLPFLVWSGPIVAGLLAVLAWRWWHSRQRRVLTLAIVFILMMIPGGAFWYLRALCQTGWIFYPVQVTIAGHTFGEGLATEGLVSVPRPGLPSLAYPWFEWKNSGYNYSEGSGVGPHLPVFAAVGLLYLLLRRRRGRSRPPCPATWTILGLIALGYTLELTLFQSHPRYAFPLWTLLLAASAPLLGLLLRRAAPLTVPLLCLTVCLSVAMTGLWSAKRLLGRVRDGDLSRAYLYEIPPVIDTLPPGTVVLNLGEVTANYPLLGAAWTNVVLSPKTAVVYGLTPPLTHEALAARGVDVVYMRGDGPPPFADDVEFHTIFDNCHDPDRRPTTIPTRIYGVGPLPPPAHP